MNAWSRLAQRPSFVAVVLLALLALHAPSLGWGFLADDWGQRLVLEQPEDFTTMRPWSLYDFGDAPRAGEPEYEEGVFPWWTGSDWKVRFFRPVTSVLLALDARLFGRWALAHHVVGLAWHAAFLLVAWRLFLALGLPRGTALLALLVLGCDDGAVTPVGWIANRNAELEGVFSAGALLCALRARRANALRPAIVALVLALLALGSKESGIAALLGCALLLGTGAGRMRAGRRLAVVCVALGVGYLGFLAAAGYGARCRFYPTPWGAPGAWAGNLAGLLGGGLLGTVSPFPVDVTLLVPGGYFPLVAACALVVAALARPWVRAARALELGPQLAAFGLLALLPGAGAPPSDRLLYVPALAFAPITATCLTAALGSSQRRARIVARVLLASALPLSALLLVARGLQMRTASGALARAFAEAEVERTPSARRDVLLLQCPSVLSGLSPLAGWRFSTGEWLTRLHALQLGRRGLDCRRLDANTLELTSLDGPFLDSLFESVFLGSTTPEPGARAATCAFDVEVVAPERIRVELHRSLEDGQVVLLAWIEGAWRKVTLPSSGATLRLPTCAPLVPGMP